MIAPAAYISEICRLYIVALFLFAVAGKLRAFEQFEKTIAEGTNLSPRFGRQIAIGVVAGEALAALLSSINGIWAERGVALALFLSLAFAGFVITMMLQGKLIRCSCFGETDDRIGVLDLLRNGLLIGACLFYLFGARQGNTIPVTSYVLLLAMAIIGLLVSINLKGIAGVLRVE